MNISRDISGDITVTFRYDPAIVEKIRMIQGQRWHPVGKYWSFPDNQETLALFLDMFARKKVSVDPALKTKAPIGSESTVTKADISDEIQLHTALKKKSSSPLPGSPEEGTCHGKLQLHDSERIPLFQQGLPGLCREEASCRRHFRTKE